MSVINELNRLKIGGFNPKKILDIGANIGEFADMCRAVWSETTCYMVEANRNCEKHLITKNQPYFIEVLGENDNEDIIFYLTSDNEICTGNSVYLEKTQHYNEDKLIKEVRKTKRVDDLFKDVNFDLMKLDTQGSELDIIKGSLKTIESIKYVIIETSIKEYNLNAPLEKEVIDYMKSIGFNKYNELESHVWPVDNGPFKKGEVFQRDLIFYKG